MSSSSVLSSDEHFVRRAYLDVLGVVPQVEETVAFLDSNDPNKRAHLIDRLLDRPERAEFWAQYFADLFVSGSMKAVTKERRSSTTGSAMRSIRIVLITRLLEICWSDRKPVLQSDGELLLHQSQARSQRPCHTCKPDSAGGTTLNAPSAITIRSKNGRRTIFMVLQPSFRGWQRSS